jgi:hypothetical protein
MLFRLIQRKTYNVGGTGINLKRKLLVPGTKSDRKGICSATKLGYINVMREQGLGLNKRGHRRARRRIPTATRFDNAIQVQNNSHVVYTTSNEIQREDNAICTSRTLVSLLE